MSLALANRAMPREFSLDIANDDAPPPFAFAPPFLWTGPRLVGFCGPAGAGKSTAAALLVEAHGFERVRFAGPLKAMMRALGLSERETEGDLKEAPSPLLCGRSPRQAMQWLGTEWGRDMIGARLWVAAWARQADAALARATPVVADDVRFPDEAAAIRERGGLVVRIDRPGAFSASGSGHPSEALAFAPDLVIANAAGLAALELAVARLAEV